MIKRYKINSEEQFRSLQLRLFESGFLWISSGRTLVKETDSHLCFFADDDGYGRKTLYFDSSQEKKIIEHIEV